MSFVYLFQKAFKLFVFPIIWLWSYFMKVILDTCRYVRFYLHYVTLFQSNLFSNDISFSSTILYYMSRYRWLDVKERWTYIFHSTWWGQICQQIITKIWLDVEIIEDYSKYYPDLSLFSAKLYLNLIYICN